MIGDHAAAIYGGASVTLDPIRVNTLCRLGSFRPRHCRSENGYGLLFVQLLCYNYSVQRNAAASQGRVALVPSGKTARKRR